MSIDFPQFSRDFPGIFQVFHHFHHRNPLRSTTRSAENLSSQTQLNASAEPWWRRPQSAAEAEVTSKKCGLKKTHMTSIPYINHNYFYEFYKTDCVYIYICVCYYMLLYDIEIVQSDQKK